MLTTVENVLLVPGMSSAASVPVAWLNQLIGAADSAIKAYCKQELEQGYFVEFYSGNQQRDLVLRQMPVSMGNTTIASGSNGAVLPQATINVASTKGFHPGTGGNASPDLALPGFAVQTGTTTWSYVNYTGTTGTAFTGCTLGTGSLSTSNVVYSPAVWFDAGGYGGQAVSSFAAGTQFVPGVHYYTVLDRGATQRRSNRGTLRRIGGAGAGFIGFWPEVMWQGKLGGTRLPIWSRGDSNIKVAYTAGFAPYSRELRDIGYACAMLVAQMVRIQPDGANLSSENLANYSYQTLVTSENPEMGEIRRVLAPYREVAFGMD